MKKGTILKYIMLVLSLTINIFIIANGFIKGNQSSQISNGAADIVLPIINDMTGDAIKTEPQIAAYRSVFRKLIGHFSLFGFSGVLTTITVYLFSKDTVIGNHLFIMPISLVIGSIVATVSELAQIPTDGRSASFKDVGIDMMGYFLGILFIIFCLFLMHRDIFKIKRKKQA